jgi:predicted dehydrogenase
MTHTRRRFLRNSASLAAGAGALSALALPSRAAAKGGSANDKLVLGAIGLNGMGFMDLQSLLLNDGVECGALCDVDSHVLNKRAGEVEKLTGIKPKLYGDYRKLLDNKDIDAVLIATPDHWHCLPMVEACQAGKDVYCEKPLGYSVEECQVMIAAAKRYNRVVQIGQWQRSGPHWTEAMDFVHSGKLGRIRTVRAWAYMNWFPPVPKIPDEPIPQGVDYDMWLGPAPKRPFNPNRFHFNFRFFWDYAGGLMTDWGVHILDVVLWGMQANAPNTIVASGGKLAYPDDAQETPDTLTALYEFDDFLMVWEHATMIGLGPFQRSHGIAFVGNNGTLVVDRQGWELFPEDRLENRRTVAYRMEARPPIKMRQGERGLDQHTENFIDCIKTREQPRCNPEIGSLAAINAHLGNIAFRTGTKLHWDSAKMQFKDNAKANALLRANYRDPWKLPEV